MISANTVKHERFSDFYDATSWLEHYLEEMPDGQVLHEARIVYLNGQWVTGISYGPSQLTFEFEGAIV